MSTKVPENCPKCGRSTMPEDRVLQVKFMQYIWAWRYFCQFCDWFWANELQRKHNDRELDKAMARARGAMYF